MRLIHVIQLLHFKFDILHYFKFVKKFNLRCTKFAQMKTRQTNPFVRSEYFMRQITAFYNNLRQTSKPYRKT